jgi:hypothetical protein
MKSMSASPAVDAAALQRTLRQHLPRGRYSVMASRGAQTVSRTVSIGKGDHERMVLYFNVPGADVREG